MDYKVHRKIEDGCRIRINGFELIVCEVLENRCVRLEDPYPGDDDLYATMYRIVPLSHDLRFPWEIEASQCIPYEVHFETSRSFEEYFRVKQYHSDLEKLVIANASSNKLHAQIMV